MLSSQRKIHDHDPQFHDATLSYINQMPDFRPKETQKHMKTEEQDNWERISHEMEAISYNQEHIDFLNMINGGNKEELDKWIDSKEIIEEFFFSYPALSWLMFHISPPCTIIPLFILQGKNLDQITMKKEYINYIRNEETAKTLRYLYPSIITDEEIIQRGKENHLKTGYLYWLISGSFNGIRDMRNDQNRMFHSLIDSEDMILFRLFIPPMENSLSDQLHYAPILCLILEKLINKDFYEGIEYLLNTFKFGHSYLESHIHSVISGGNEQIVALFLNAMSLNISKKILEDVVIYILLGMNNYDILNLLMFHECTKKIIQIIEVRNDYALLAIKSNNIALIRILLKYMKNKLLQMMNNLLNKAIKLRREKILKVLLSVTDECNDIKINLLNKARSILEEK